ncbi:MAG TPA: FapA family protein [Planctomycetota bacterium]|nr:FapA family protein [Planctomycetota bacterium]
MDRIRITISGDGLSAEAAVTRGPRATLAELRNALAASVITFGVHDEAVATLGARLADPGFEGRAIVATGRPATHGEDGRVDVVEHELKAGEAQADGSIDYRERFLLRPIRRDQQVARIVPPTPGQDGSTVRGVPIVARPGKPHRVRFGLGVRVEGDIVRASRGGVLASDARLLDVVPLFTHAGDVDYHSGNLHSEGSLAIRGDVRAGFTVSAANDLHIAGSVLDGTVVADGSVRIELGVLGPDSVVQAGGDLYCRHATSASLSAGPRLTIADQAVHCQLRADAVLAQTGRGTVLGGEVRAGSSIVVRVAGSAAGAPTHLVVGDANEAAAALVKATNQDQKLAERARERARGSDRGAGGKARRQAMRLEVPTEQATLAMRNRQRELLRLARIEIIDTLHAGVRITFGEHERPYSEACEHIRLRWDEANQTIVEERMP